MAIFLTFAVYKYTSFGGVQLPRRLRYLYNEENMRFDCLIGDVRIDPAFPSFGISLMAPLRDINMHG